jgi:hypothetical protein
MGYRLLGCFHTRRLNTWQENIEVNYCAVAVSCLQRSAEILNFVRSLLDSLPRSEMKLLIHDIQKWREGAFFDIRQETRRVAVVSWRFRRLLMELHSWVTGAQSAWTGKCVIFESHDGKENLLRVRWK